MNQCPDEEGRMLLTRWIYDKGILPTGNEKEIMIPGWGFSYALRPYLSSIIGAMFMRVVSLFTISEQALLTASRMTSVLAITCCFYFCLRLGHCLFRRRSSAVLLAMLVCYLPQVMFLGMYQNCDSLSLAAVGAMLTVFVEGNDKKWRFWDCVRLGFAVAAALLSYYSVYGWIFTIAIVCMIAVLSDSTISEKGKVIIRAAATVMGICLICAGWFFIRNAALHDGDFLGLSSEQASREAMRLQGLEIQYNSPMLNGESVLDFFRIHGTLWRRLTMQSFIGVFGYMNIFMGMEWYGIYYAILVTGVIFYLIRIIHIHPTRKEGLLVILMLVSTIIGIVLHFWQSYSRDIQPQGRYIETTIFYLAYMFAAGVDGTEFRIQGVQSADSDMVQKKGWVDVRFDKLGVIVILIWVFLFFKVFFSTMIQMIPK